jgi:hypothetical protein
MGEDCVSNEIYDQFFLPIPEKVVWDYQPIEI